MIRVCIREARARLSELPRLAQRELVIFARGGSSPGAHRPVAVMIGVEGRSFAEVEELAARFDPRSKTERRRGVEPGHTTPSGRGPRVKRRKVRRR